MTDYYSTPTLARRWAMLITAFFLCVGLHAQDFQMTSGGYLQHEGVDVMAFYDFYPEGHQGGVSLLMNGHRVATNGDLRLEATPGQWQPVPKLLSRQVEGNSIVATLQYPDSSRHLTGFNPTIYPDLQLRYTVRTEAVGNHIEVTVDLDRPLPKEWIGKVGFNFEFYPGSLFGKPWLMDAQGGIYPQQPNAPLATTVPNYLRAGQFHPAGQSIIDFQRFTCPEKGYNPIIADDIIAQPYCVGRTFVSRPDDPYSKVTIESKTADLKLYDGRMNHNNGWFVLRSEIPAGVARGAIKWIITPHVVKGWHYSPVIQTSQVGYQTRQPKRAVIEMDPRDAISGQAELVKIGSNQPVVVRQIALQPWGRFLRYQYARIDFSDVTEPGLYQLRYGESQSAIFRIDDSVYDRGVWQPVVEYFLPVQMCHMRVNEKYRVWHGACHMDDARMARNENAFDGYDQHPGLSPYAEEEAVPGLAVGGWHDAGDFDLRIESQIGESYNLAMIYEQFHPDIDVTTIDQQRHLTEIHQADGRNDILQQIEHGALSVCAGYRALGRPYRGIICHDLRQYAMLGDAAAMTDGVAGNDDDRWVYTEDNPMRDLSTAASLAGTARVLRHYNDTLAAQCLEMAQSLFARDVKFPGMKLHAAVELYLTTGDRLYRDYILQHQDAVVKGIARTASSVARLARQWEQQGDKQEQRFAKAFRKALPACVAQMEKEAAKTPYGVPYEPSIWGAGWGIQGFGVQYYYLTKYYPELFRPQPVFSALDFILGCHPGSNTASFASGVGAKSATVAYGANRADWSYVPGGVVSGTAIIRPDFPELLEFPFLWQQTEYVLGGGSSNYMFLVLAARQLMQP